MGCPRDALEMPKGDPDGDVPRGASDILRNAHAMSRDAHHGMPMGCLRDAHDMATGVLE